jgi:hypothetical protein
MGRFKRRRHPSDLEGLEPSCDVVGRQEVGEVCSQLLVAVVMQALDGGLVDRAVHPFDLAIGPWMVGFGQPVLDPVGLADHVEARLPGIDGIPVPRLLCELDAVIGENGMDLVGTASSIC